MSIIIEHPDNISSVSQINWDIKSQTVSVWKARERKQQTLRECLSLHKLICKVIKLEKCFLIYSHFSQNQCRWGPHRSVDVGSSDCRGNQHQRFRPLYRCWNRVVSKGFWVWKNLYLLKDRNVFKVVLSSPPSEKDLWLESKEIWIYRKYLDKKTIRQNVTNHCSESFTISPMGYCSVQTGQWTWWKAKSILNHLSLGEAFVIVPGTTHSSLSASQLKFDLTMKPWLAGILQVGWNDWKHEHPSCLPLLGTYAYSHTHTHKHVNTSTHTHTHAPIHCMQTHILIQALSHMYTHILMFVVCGIEEQILNAWTHLCEARAIV